MKTIDDLLADIEDFKIEARGWTEEEFKSLTYSRLITMARSYRPAIQEIGNDANIDKEIRAHFPNYIEAMRFCRAKLGISLMEARDYVERLKAS